MNILESLRSTGNHALALKTASFLLRTYDVALAGCENEAEEATLKVAFSEALRSER